MVGIRILYGWDVVIFVAHTCSTWLNTETGALEGVESAMLRYVEAMFERGEEVRKGELSVHSNSPGSLLSGYRWIKIWQRTE